ncbi:WhiB family transcriptional regulator [Streptomyces rectiviolaceus]|uniref:Transcriptional regulator WhiB n=1 Tax=Streptomyces rectiviolaceus TaxID=332591 RepID=A0ABP6NP16_9ACTN
MLNLVIPQIAGSDWRKYAGCRQVDPELFFPGKGPAGAAQARDAKQVCSLCPVAVRCLQWALTNRQDSGVWGGMTESDRRVLHGRRPGRTRPASGKPVAQELLDMRGQEFLELQRKGRSPMEIAQSLGTNVQTVNNMQRLYEQLQADASRAVESAGVAA